MPQGEGFRAGSLGYCSFALIPCDLLHQPVSSGLWPWESQRGTACEPPPSGSWQGVQEPVAPFPCVVRARQPSRPVGAPALRRQAQLHPLDVLQNFLYKCIGTTLGAASSKEVVRKHLQELLETARYQEEAEREVRPPPQPLCALRRSACVCERACISGTQMGVCVRA